MRDGQSGLMLLDTHAWVWIMSGHERLSPPRISAALEKGVRASGLRVAAISLWEVAMLESKDRIGFGIPIMEWMKQATSAPGISVSPLSMEAVVESTMLPGRFHGDPADRIIVATARVLRALLVTADQKIIEYGRGGFLNVLAV